MGEVYDIVVAVDVGAAYTKVGIQRDGMGVKVFNERGVPAVPTVLHVGPGGETSIDNPLPPANNWTKLEWFKLFLVHEYDWPEHAKTSPLVKDADNRRRETGMDPVDVTATFLRHLWDKASGFISRTLRRSDLRGLRVRLVVTLPAHWPADAARRMKGAIAKSGIAGSVERVSTVRMAEPEAAALASLTDLSQDSDMTDRPAERDLVVVCDCGGLTVDVATYEITSTEGGRYALDQRVLENSRICGSAFIEDAFYKLLSVRVCTITGDQSAMGKVGREFIDGALCWWRTTLHTVRVSGGSESFPMQVPLAYPGLPSSYFGGDGHLLSFTGREIMGVFDPMFEHIVELVEAQDKAASTAARKYLLITGGMGSNALIQSMLTQRFGDRMRILCWRDGRTWPAVARGAAMHHGIGRDPLKAGPVAMVRTHLACATYGLLYNGTTIEWLIQKGAPIQTDAPMLYKIPSTAVSAVPPAHGNSKARHTLTICSTAGPASQAGSTPDIVCSMTWEGCSPGVSPSTITATLGITYDSCDGVAFGIYQNGQRLEGVEIDDSPF